tara:strand:- start:335 stop:1006 length:672 start_codon:yes stop_codon:yes gene_type:complete
MGSKPKKDDYKATDSEVASSAVAQAEYTYFKQNYEPLLLEMRDKARNENFRDSIRGRASADVAQALTGDLSLNQATNVSALGDIAGAYSGQLQKADEAALGVKNTMSTGVLGTARKQAAEAQTGMAQASRLATSQALTAARANQQVAQSKLDAGMQIAGAITLGAIDKYGRNSQPAKTGAQKGMQSTSRHMEEKGMDMMMGGYTPISKPSTRHWTTGALRPER